MPQKRGKKQMMTKKVIKEAIQLHKDLLEKAKQTIENSEGSRYASCSMSYDIGYWEGRLKLLQLQATTTNRRKQ